MELVWTMYGLYIIYLSIYWLSTCLMLYCNICTVNRDLLHGTCTLKYKVLFNDVPI